MRYADEAPESLLANPQNWRLHPREQTAALNGSITELGWIAPVIVNETTQHVVDGHARIGEAIARGEPSVPVAYVKLTEDQERLALATFDPIAAMAGTDQKMLDDLLSGLTTADSGLDALLASLASETTQNGESSQGVGGLSLSDRFIVPPFSVLDARQGYWQERKRQWLAIGIQSELGRGDSPRSSTSAAAGEEPTYRQIRGSNGLLGFSEQARSHYATPSGSAWPPATLGADGKTVRGDGRGRSYHTSEWVRGLGLSEPAQAQSGTSIFDPVLCELAYRWFCPPSGSVLDPLAGGSVRGIVASLLGRTYTGIELRPEQVAANESQRDLCRDPQPKWITGDAVNTGSLAAGEYDFVFSCPPYADLERYSDDPCDLSTMEYGEFLESYRQIIAACIGMLRDDRFACFVVGDIRDKTGMYRGFIGDTVNAFRAAGAKLYNEAILVTAAGSLPIRVGGMFSSLRKLGKTHQNVLVFIKGDPRKAAIACGDVEVSLPIEDTDGAA